MQSIDISGVIDAMKTKDLSNAIDQACEVGFTLGEISENDRWLNILDKLEATLLDSEEDAKMTIHVIRALSEKEEES
jgi:hypothetical protein